jgi:hypothetical protein
MSEEAAKTDTLPRRHEDTEKRREIALSISVEDSNVRAFSAETLKLS